MTSTQQADQKQTNKQRPAAELAAAQQRNREYRRAEVAKARRRRLLIRIGAPTAAVLVVLGVFLIIKATSSDVDTTAGPSTPAPAAVTAAVGAGSGVNPMTN